MISAYIFDLDGVLVDTAQYHFRAWQRLAESLGVPLTAAHEQLLRGLSRMDSLGKILSWGALQPSAAECEDLAEQKNRWYQEYIQHMDRNELLPGVLTFLEAARDNGIRMVVASASKNAHLVLEKTQLADFFDQVIDGHQLTRGKPDPQAFLLAAEGARVAPRQAVVYEDAPAGIEGAIAGGFWAVGIGLPEKLSEAHIVLPDLQSVTPDSLNQQFYNLYRI